MWARDVVETVKWIAPGSDVVELRPTPTGPSWRRPDTFNTKAPAKVERLTATQIVLDNGSRYRLESYEVDDVHGVYCGRFDAPMPFDRRYSRYAFRSLLVHPDDPRVQAAIRAS